MYASRAAFSQHEALSHPFWLKDIDRKCLFCKEDIGFGRRERARHIGHHMEEIAFAIVTKPYEEWDFYSMSSESYLDAGGLWHSEPTSYPCICHDCGLKLHTVAERAKHFVSIHGLTVAEAQAQFGGGFRCHRRHNIGQRTCNLLFPRLEDLERHLHDCLFTGAPPLDLPPLDDPQYSEED